MFVILPLSYVTQTISKWSWHMIRVWQDSTVSEIEFTLCCDRMPFISSCQAG